MHRSSIRALQLFRVLSWTKPTVSFGPNERRRFRVENVQRIRRLAYPDGVCRNNSRTAETLTVGRSSEGRNRIKTKPLSLGQYRSYYVPFVFRLYNAGAWSVVRTRTNVGTGNRLRFARRTETVFEYANVSRRVRNVPRYVYVLRPTSGGE